MEDEYIAHSPDSSPGDASEPALPCLPTFSAVQRVDLPAPSLDLSDQQVFLFGDEHRTEDDNPPDVPGRTEVQIVVGGDELYLETQGVDVVQQEFRGVDVGHLTPPRLLLGATTSVADVGHLTPLRHKKRAIGKKLTPKKKNV